MTEIGSRLEDDVEAVLVASRALVGVVARSIAEVLEQVTLPQFRVLVVLHGEGPMRSGDLAERLGIHQSTFTRTADRLVASGWISREPSSESRREVIVDLSDAGRRLVAEVLSARQQDFQGILAQASSEQRAAIRRGFAAFADLAGEPDARHLLTLGM